MAGSKGGRLDPRLFRALWLDGPMAIRSDADLVRVFVDAHGEAAEAAFEALVARHGPMVLGVCRRMLRDDHAAEDAFQAVFLVLARRADSVRVDDSLGLWLHGVTRRVAARARNWHAREVAPSSARREGPIDPASEVVRDEVRRLVALEVARLPRKYREVVDLCHIDGLGHDATAEALGIPVGTVRSRLSRARDYLRPRLARRGLAPSSFAAWVGRQPSGVGVPRALLEITLANAGRVANVATAPAVLALFHQTMRSYAMANVWKAGTLVAVLGSMAAGALVLARGGDEPARPIAPAAQVVAAKPVPKPADSLRDQYRKIVGEYDAAEANGRKVAARAGSEFERYKILTEVLPEEADFARRIVDLAVAHPKDPASREFLIWVIHKPRRSDTGAFGDEFARAVRLLVDHHADDPEVARAGLGMANILSRHRDAFLEGIYASATNREAKGLIRLALAIYLEKKAVSTTSARKFPGRTVAHWKGYDDQGKLVDRTQSLSNEDEGYRTYERMLDADYVRRECERLYEEVVAEYADILYISTHRRDLERQARETPSATIADPEKKREMIEIEEYLATEKPETIGKVAADRLDDLRNLVVGKVAPGFEGVGADARPIRLADFRGKVVVMTCWFSTCGPCVSEIPTLRELAGKLAGRPFSLLGIVTDGRADEARKLIEAERMTWPNLVGGGDKVADQYHVNSNPWFFVIDAAGVIRAKGRMEAASLAGLVEPLVAEAERNVTTNPQP